MADIHITRELLSAVARGELPPRMLVETGLYLKRARGNPEMRFKRKPAS